MSDRYDEIKEAFLCGIDEVFTVMFTNKVKLYLMDTTNTAVNLYDESKHKVYSETPIELVAKVVTTFEQGEEPVQGIQIDAEITVPTKQLIDKNVARSTEEDLEALRKAKFIFKEHEYLVEKVTPKTLVADEWQFYSFACRVDKKTSIS